MKSELLVGKKLKENSKKLKGKPETNKTAKGAQTRSTQGNGTVNRTQS